MSEDVTLEDLKLHNQNQIIDHYERLHREKKREFLGNLNAADLNLAFEIYRRFKGQEDHPSFSRSMEPAPVIPIPRTEAETARMEQARELGESIIRRQETAVLIVAGGQGSRLGFDGPKGAFPVSPVKKKTLFQLFAEALIAASRRYETEIPLLVMTSQENHDATVDFFVKNDYFRLNEKDVRFFQQGQIPSVTPGGELILKDETHIFENPDGHGGSLKALHDSGLLTRLLNKGVTDIFYCQVDNPLVTVVDPVFLGYHRMEGSEISTKTVRRERIEEKVGVCVIADGRPAIIEYSDMNPSHMSALDGEGNILYWAGNTAIHIVDLGFVKRLNYHGFALPYHRAVKEIDAFQGDGGLSPGLSRGEGGGKSSGENLKKVTGWKFETFVFDAIPLAQKACFMEVIRREEFSPVKNSTGADSPETAEMDMVDLHKGWLEKAGIKTASGVKVEVSPLFALDGDELALKLKGKASMLERDTYFE